MNVFMQMIEKLKTDQERRIIPKVNGECICQMQSFREPLAGHSNWPDDERKYIGLYADFTSNRLYVNKEYVDGVDFSFGVEISYCPFCGKKLRNPIRESKNP